MKKIYALCILLSMQFAINGQILSPEVILSSGGEFANSEAQISWTLGDFQTTTYVKEQLVLTQGFLQNDIKITSVLELDNSNNIKLNVFPNPVTNLLNIHVLSSDNKQISWQLINQNGAVIKYDDITDNNTEIDFSSFQSGIYFLRTFSKESNYFKIYKIVKINY